MLRGSLNGKGADACLSKAESLHCSPETITTLLIGYTPMQNKKLKKKKKNWDLKKKSISKIPPKKERSTVFPLFFFVATKLFHFCVSLFLFMESWAGN